MAIAVMAVRQHGASNGNSEVIRFAGATAITIGHPFTILWLNGGITNGPFQIGETVTGSNSLAIGKVIHINVNGFPTAIWISVTGGAAFNNTDVVTGTNSGAFGTASGIGIGNNGSNGVFPPETDLNPNTNNASNRVLTFNGGLYASLNAYVIKLIGEDWTIVHTAVQSAQIGFGQFTCHTGLHIVNVNNQPVMGMVYGNGILYRVTTVDGTNYGESLIFGGGGISSINSVGREIVFNNILYFIAGYSNNNATYVWSWDPNTDIGVFDVGGLGIISFASDIITYSNTLTVLKLGTGGQAALFTYNGGGWVQSLVFADGSIVGGGGTPSNMQWGMWAPNDGFLYCMYGAYFNPFAGWLVKKVQVSSGVWSDVTPLLGGNKTLGPTVLAGTGLPIWDNTAFNDPSMHRVYVNVDNVTVPGTPAVYIYEAINDTVGTPIKVMQWNGPSSAVTSLGFGADISFAQSNVLAGGGERFWNYEQPGVIVINVNAVANGERLNFKAFPGITTGTVAVLNGNAGVVGTETDFLTFFSIGDKLIFANQPGVIYTVLTVTDDQHLTLTTPFGGANNSKTTVAFSGTKSVQFWFGQNGQPQAQQCSLTNIVSLGPAPLPTLSGNQVNGVTLDGVTVYQVTWLALVDGAVNLTRADVDPVAF